MDSAKKRYLREYITALARASYRGFEITDTLVVIVIIVLGIWSFYSGDGHGAVHPPWQLVALIAAIFVLYKVLAVSFWLYAEQRVARELLEVRLLPQLEIGVPQIVRTTIFSPPIPAAYLRVAVRNHGDATAIGCTARLTEIEHLGRDGYRPLGYTDTLEMVWSNKPPDRAHEIDIYPHLAETLDVAFAYQGNRNLHLAATVRPPAYEGLMSIAGQYRFTILVASAGRAPLTFKICCHWGFGIDTFTLPADPISIVAPNASA